MALLKVICWAIIFITRLRFPPGKSLATILNIMHYILPTPTKTPFWPYFADLFAFYRRVSQVSANFFPFRNSRWPEKISTKFHQILKQCMAFNLQYRVP